MKKASVCCIFATELLNPSLLHGSTHPCDRESTDKKWHGYSKSVRRPAPWHRLSSERKSQIQFSFTHVKNPTSWNEPVKLQAEYIAIYLISIIICIWRWKSFKIQTFLIHVTRTSRRGLGKKIPDFAFMQCSDMSTAPSPICTGASSLVFAGLFLKLTGCITVSSLHVPVILAFFFSPV